MEKVRCDFCYYRCLLAEGEIGICQIRKNVSGVIKTIGYGQIVASAIDPIEKKPMYHLLPGSETYSVALFGCNYKCLFCQNHTISQAEGGYYQAIVEKSYFKEIQPAKLMDSILASKSPVVSYTYSEPVVWQDYMLDVAQLAQKQNLLNCMVTNGSFSKESLERTLEFIDAFNIDLKGNQDFYKNHCSGALKPVLDSIETIAAKEDKVLEITTLLVEELQSLEEIKFLAKELANRGVKVWHLSRFFPHYKMRHLKPTSEEFLIEAINIAKDADIEYVYAGNSRLIEYYPTICPNCKTVLIEDHSKVTTYDDKIVEGKCFNCKTEIYGMF